MFFGLLLPEKPLVELTMGNDIDFLRDHNDRARLYV